ncbi:hypothetical protein FWD20_03230 [Candidatus Saccharibacteria bacterium]|nr:hypothetical protein [Candidatus Saccharibacteria bacterium]
MSERLKGRRIHSVVAQVAGLALLAGCSNSYNHPDMIPQQDELRDGCTAVAYNIGSDRVDLFNWYKRLYLATIDCFNDDSDRSDPWYYKIEVDNASGDVVVGDTLTWHAGNGGTGKWLAQEPTPPSLDVIK